MKKNRALFSPSITTLLMALGGVSLSGCGDQAATPAATSSTNEALAALAACGLDDGTIEPDAHLRACDPQDVKKTTICHIPPGNPANAHTICVGNAAVSHHVENHGDLVGPCQAETPCVPPPPCSASHGKGKDASDGGGGACSMGTGGVTGTDGGSPSPTCPDGQMACASDPSVCPAETSTCFNGCCVPWTPL
jgi:hypothetical protein